MATANVPKQLGTDDLSRCAGNIADLTLELACAFTEFADSFYPGKHPITLFARHFRKVAREMMHNPELIVSFIPDETDDPDPKPQ